MPKTIEFGSESSGLQVTYTKSRRELRLFGWYDHCVGIEPHTIGLGDFFRRLGIDERAIRAALLEVGE